MGMYDRVFIPCIECGRRVEFQSKAGDCLLNSYTIKDIPPEIAGDLDGEKVVCECGTIISIETQFTINVIANKEASNEKQ